jgi:putative hydrolases of HD superfamily
MLNAGRLVASVGTKRENQVTSPSPLEQNAMRSEDLAADAPQLLNLLHHIEPLKHLARAGWVDRDVAQPESVAAHSWRLAMMAWLCAEAQGMDAARALRLALVHDVAEAVTGDTTPFSDHAPDVRRALASESPDVGMWREPARRAQKVALEREALATILAGTPAHAAAVISEAWEEYELGASPEAKLVRQLDKLEAYIQGWEYARDGRLPHPETLNSFTQDTHHQVQDPMLRTLLTALETWAHSSGADSAQELTTLNVTVTAQPG